MKNAILILFFSVIIFLPQLTLATKINETGLDTTAKKAFGDPIPFAGQSMPQMIGQLVGWVLSFVGILFLVLMIAGGLLWMAAGGDESKVTKAKEIIMAAIIGLVIVFSAYAITKLVGEALSKA